MILLCLLVACVTFGSLPCLPCVGLMVEDSVQAVSAVELIPSLGEGETLFVAWNVPLDGTFEPGVVAQVEASGATPWLVVSFETEWPPADYDDQLASELAVLSEFLPGYPAAIYAAAAPDEPGDIAVEAARNVASGAGTTLFDFSETQVESTAGHRVQGEGN